MRDVLDERTIVIVGSWNVAILNPEWVAKTLFDSKQTEIQIIIASGQPTLRHKFNDVSINAQSDKVVISALNTSVECMSQCEHISTKLLSLLPVTPVSGVGINFGFVQDEIPEDLAKVFDTPDIPALFDNGLQIKQTNLIRHLAFEDRELRLRLTLTEENSLSIHLNYHKNVQSTQEARDSLSEKAIHYFNTSKDILKNIYNLEGEESE